MDLRTAVAYLLDLSDRNKPFNWLVGHTVAPIALTLIFALFGHALVGAWTGMAIYLWREAEVVGAHWVKTGAFRVSKDSIGDIAGPIAVFLVTLCLTI